VIQVEIDVVIVEEDEFDRGDTPGKGCRNRCEPNQLKQSESDQSMKSPEAEAEPGKGPHGPGWVCGNQQKSGELQVEEGDSGSPRRCEEDQT
jgi:hypothetical protein